MKNVTAESIDALLDNIFSATKQAARKICDAVGTMSWQRLALTCIGIALLISMIPFVVTIFVALVVVKLVVSAMASQERKQREEQAS
jgi:hypothetical protein